MLIRIRGLIYSHLIRGDAPGGAECRLNPDNVLVVRVDPATAGRCALDRCAPQTHPGLMLIDSVREFNRTFPFEPYELRMVSGERYRVPHPDFILISPRGNYIIIVDAKNHPHHLSTLLIERGSPVRNGRRRTSRKRGPGPRKR